MNTAASVTMTIDKECTACGLCLVTCPESALVRAPNRPAFKASLCTSCLACIEVCPRDAITIHDAITVGLSQ